MDYVMRTVRPEEWPAVKELRLAALQDPAAPVAFLDTYEAASRQPDSYWEDRAAGRGGVESQQFVAEGPDGRWVGTVTVLIERPSVGIVFGTPIEAVQGHLVGVYVRPEFRGTGLTDALFRAAVDWAWALEDPVLARVRLFVHEENPRAQAFYRRFGFVPSGDTMLVPGTVDGARELEFVLPRS
ncbi:GNAT family N-acetyltransferase [uncultured Streptomyces sp.]|uniref:GNAT family N-acetyltransferase n=1 Tax=uncultured Streptomyces sp. TaxID=174707 RepID=UPI00262B5D9E|nr:GNAT family N-acetyltransferase [uncultured Streptomyces sp.]